MAIDKKLIHFKSWNKFISDGVGSEEHVTKPTSGTEEEGTAIYGQIKGTSIVFIKDASKIWTHGKVYDGSTINVDELQNKLVSGENIKTINGTSILGEGDITIESGYPDANIQAVDVGEEIEDVNIEYVTKDELQDAVENINPTPMVSVTYSELVDLRNNGELIAGMQYRITDYVTTTAQENTRSAGHPFDVIVTADSNNALNEVARACLHEGDDYFLNEAPKLEAWKIWYCLDNDTERFAWADTENGKGVIYRMIDEWNNDLPYDFKNIMFKRYELNAPELYEASGNDYWIQKQSENIRAMFNLGCYAFIWSGLYEQDKYWENDYEAVMSTPTGRSRFFYTFSDDSDISFDSSLGGTCGNNVMPSCYRLPNNVFFGGGEHYGNRFGSNCYDNSFSFDFVHNTFGSDCCENCFGTSCYYNTFGNSCSYNSFGYDCQYNNSGNRFNYNSLGDNCSNNSFGNGFEYNGLGMESSYNAFGNDCCYNGFGRYYQYNRLGNICWYNCFGDKFKHNSFGVSCQNNIFKDASGMAHDVKYSTLENGVSSVEFYFDDTTETYTSLRWHHVYSGVEDCKIELYDNRRYETCYACDQQGNVHTFCIMDFKNS